MRKACGINRLGGHHHRAPVKHDRHAHAQICARTREPFCNIWGESHGWCILV
jgi:hypothetical protein